MALRLKVIGALLLLACFALPMKSCTTQRDEAGKLVVVAPSDPIPQGVRTVNSYYYLLDEFRADDPWTWFAIVGFICPAAAVAYSRSRPRSRPSRAIWFIEPMLIVWVILSIEYVSFFIFHASYNLEIGTYVAIAGVSLYSLGWISEAYGRLRAWWQRRRRAAA